MMAGCTGGGHAFYCLFTRLGRHGMYLMGGARLRGRGERDGGLYKTIIAHYSGIV